MLKNFISEWEQLTSDKTILDIVKGCHLEFENNKAPVQISKPFEPCFSAAESCVIDNEVKLLLEMNVIEELSEYADLSDGFISTIFTRPKRNGSYRVILNLKEFNKNIVYHHFKMDTFESALELVTQGCYFASVDFSNAYYSVCVAEEHRKF